MSKALDECMKYMRITPRSAAMISSLHFATYGEPTYYDYETNTFRFYSEAQKRALELDHARNMEHALR